MKLYLYSLWLFTCILLCVQGKAQSWQWAKQPVFTGHPTDQSDGEAWALTTDNSGNAYETGFFAYATMRFGNTFLNSVNPTAFISKYDANGNPLWAHQGVLNSEYDESVSNAVAVDASGNVYITGFFMDSVTFGNITLVTNPGQQQSDFLEVFLVKYNANGIVQWARQSNTNRFNPYRNQGFGVACDRTGNIYVCGQFGNTIYFGADSLSCIPGGEGNAFLVKYDTNGNVLWATQPAIPSSSSFALANAVTVDAFNNVCITGNFRDTITFGNQMLVNDASGGDIFVAKYDSGGNSIWAKQAVTNSIHSASPPANSGNGIATDREGSIYIAGNFADTIFFGSNELIAPFPYSEAIPYGDMLLVKYDINGNVIWTKVGEPIETVTLGGWGVTTDTLGHIYFLGGGGTSFNTGDQIIYHVKIDNDTFVSSYPTSWEFSVVIELDTSGNILCGAAIPMGGDDLGGIACDPSGRYIYIVQDYNAQGTVYLGGDTINYPAVTGEEIPFVARWSSCSKVPLLVSTIQTNVTCNGLCNGQATANPAGGTLPYKYLWNTPHSDTTKTVTGLCAGMYNVTITDSTGTTVSATVNITQPLVFKVSASPDTSLCAGDTVILKAAISGGIAPFAFTWSPGIGLSDTTTAQVVASPPDSTTYTVTATSNGSCTVSASVSVNIYSALVVSVTISANPAGSICKGTTVAFTAAPVNGGNPTYQWTVNNKNVWTNSSVYSTDSLNSGDAVACTVKSTLACTTGSPATSNLITATVTSTAQAGVISASEDTICAGSLARLTLTGNTATPAWQSSTSGSNFVNIPGADSTVYSATLQQTTNFRVIAGTGSCADTSTVFTIIVDSLPSPPILTATDSIICSDDSTKICATGAFISYLWNTGLTGSCIEVNSAGGYWVTATASNGCMVVSGHANISVYPVPSVSIIVQGDTLSSYNAVSYQWYLNDSSISGATSPVYVAHVPGLYSVLITDSNGCQALSNAVTITGISDIEQERITVFPNPSTGSWQLITGSGFMGSQLNVYSDDGRLILNSIIKSTTTELSFEAPRGIYLLQILSPTINITYKLIRL